MNVKQLAVWVTMAAVMAMGQTAPAAAPAPAVAAPVAPVGVQQDANETREELNRVLERFAPSLRQVLALDPTLITNQAYLAPYPGLSAFLAAHPEIARNPGFYLGHGYERQRNKEERVLELTGEVLAGLAAFTGVGLAIGLVTWLIRTMVDYRRWSRLAKVQTEVHTKLMDRFGTNEDLIAYIQSPAGSKFLESSPIKLDAGPRSLGAPMARILWSMQGGVVLMAAGIGLWIVSGRADGEGAQALQAFGVLALALGIGFVVSAILSYGVSRKLGLIQNNANEPPAA